MSKKISLGVAATIAIIAMAVTFSLTMVVSMKMFNTTVSSVKNKERQYNKLSEIDRFVRSEEFFTIDEDTLNDRLAAGYMNGINDKYAVYYTAKEYSEKQAVEKGTLTGIGVAVVNDASSGYARIIRLYDNSPAAEAGMQVGGFITAINDESTRNITSSARLTSKLLGEEGTTTAVTYLTPDRQEQQFNLVHSNYKTCLLYTSNKVNITVTTTTVMLTLLMASNSCIMSMDISGSMLPVGSSAMMSLGPWARARATATRCCSPPESSSGRRSILSSKPTRESANGTRSRIFLVEIFVTRMAKATFS